MPTANAAAAAVQHPSYAAAAVAPNEAPNVATAAATAAAELPQHDPNFHGCREGRECDLVRGKEKNKYQRWRDTKLTTKSIDRPELVRLPHRHNIHLLPWNIYLLSPDQLQ